jgi:hypothetical protein
LHIVCRVGLMVQVYGAAMVVLVGKVLCVILPIVVQVQLRAVVPLLLVCLVNGGRIFVVREGHRG